jgi:hypothetical protein
MLYCKPKFGEGFLGRGMGLGNRLFPWARCRIFAHMHGAKMISPVWIRPAAGQLLRGGIDYHSYLRQLILFGLFQKRSGDLSVPGGIIRTLWATRCKEPEVPRELADKNLHRNTVVVFEGWQNHFTPLNGWHDFLYRELRAITRQKYLNFADSIGDVPIGICVRSGNDFAEPSTMNYGPLAYGEKTPLGWFVESLRLIRKTTGFPAKAYVVSDGTRAQLGPLLDMESVRFVRPGSAVSDLLVLSRSRVLLASGASSFAAWGAFLGQMPSISHPGQPLTSWGITAGRCQFMGVFNPLFQSGDFLFLWGESLSGGAG